jgi:hypothetical protein
MPSHVGMASPSLSGLMLNSARLSGPEKLHVTELTSRIRWMRSRVGREARAAVRASRGRWSRMTADSIGE